MVRDSSRCIYDHNKLRITEARVGLLIITVAAMRVRTREILSSQVLLSVSFDGID